MNAAPAGPGLRADDQVDVRDLVAIADERFTDEEIRGHTCLHMRFGEERENLAKHTQLDEAKSEPAVERRGMERGHAIPRRQRVARTWRRKSCVEATSMDVTYIPVKECISRSTRRGRAIAGISIGSVIFGDHELTVKSFMSKRLANKKPRLHAAIAPRGVRRAGARAQPLPRVPQAPPRGRAQQHVRRHSLSHARLRARPRDGVPGRVRVGRPAGGADGRRSRQASPRGNLDRSVCAGGRPLRLARSRSQQAPQRLTRWHDPRTLGPAQASQLSSRGHL